MPRTAGFSLAEQAYAQLRRAIIRGDLAGDRRIVAGDLSAALRLGITPVREALARLETEGLVVTLPRRGYLVTPVTGRALREATEVWAALAPRLVHGALDRATQEQAAEIVACMTARGTLTDEPRPDLPALAESRSRGWRLLADATGNELLADLYRLLDARLTRMTVLLLDGDQRIAGRPTMDWAAIFARRDRAHAAEQLHRYLGAFRELVDEALRRRAGEASAPRMQVPEIYPEIYQASHPTAEINFS